MRSVITTPFVRCGRHCELDSTKFPWHLDIRFWFAARITCFAFSFYVSSKNSQAWHNDTWRYTRRTWKKNYYICVLCVWSITASNRIWLFLRFLFFLWINFSFSNWKSNCRTIYVVEENNRAQKINIIKVLSQEKPKWKKNDKWLKCVGLNKVSIISVKLNVCMIAADEKKKKKKKLIYLEHGHLSLDLLFGRFPCAPSIHTPLE